MKIRNGFVSNSSSSSFIVALPKEPKNIADIKLMFGNNNKYKWNKRLLSKIKAAEGFTYCEREDTKCAKCRKRFKCLTNKQLTLWGYFLKARGYSDEEIRINEEEKTVDKAMIDFMNCNIEATFYAISFCDGGEGGDDLDSEMRMNYGTILSKVPYYDLN